MKVSRRWLNEIFRFERDIEDVKDTLLNRGLEIEETFERKSILSSVFVGKVRSIKKISKELSFAEIEVSGRVYPSVTGAKNVKMGDKVPVCLPGGTIYHYEKKGDEEIPVPYRIKPMEFNGYKSEAVLLSYKEMGISDKVLGEEDKRGIFILPDDAEVGADLKEALWLEDTIFEIKTYNRADCLSLWGISQEFERLGLGKIVKEYGDVSIPSNLKDISFKIEVLDEKLCPRYVGIIIRDVKVKKAPIKILRKLITIGARPVNNIVDITNVLMFEYGQPLHAFDLDKIHGKLIIRRASKGEKIRTLDDKLRELDEGMLVIADEEGPIAIAGVMGGKETEVSHKTKNVLLESANFLPSSISVTKRRLKINSEAAVRFEKGVDIRKALENGWRASLMFGGSINEKPFDFYPEPEKEKKIKVRFERVRKIIGVDISNSDIIDSLRRGGFELENVSEKEATFVIKPFRPDISQEIDLIEEVIRYRGIENLPYTLPSPKISVFTPDKRRKLRKRIVNILTSLSMDEVITLSLLDSQYLSLYPIEREPIEVVNPLRSDQDVLRTSLIPMLLKVVDRNIKMGNKNLMFFEIGKVFYKEKDFVEKEELSGVITGKIREKLWMEKEKEFDFFYLKGVVSKLLDELKIDEVEFVSGSNKLFHPFRYAVIQFKDLKIGEMGEIHPSLLEKLSISQRVYAFSIDFETLLDVFEDKKEYESISKFPPLTFDIAIVVSEDTPSGKLVEIIKQESGEILSDIHIFDLYRGENIGYGKKSIGFRLTFSSKERTLEDKDVFPIIDRIEKRIQKELSGNLRKRN
ncbi:MAG: phenylalanine--tRNA ligase subunit beta [Caldisericia bacterium]|nr:phenylalanine--tRNA ligase subunit beta [Caldisericia bacterium]